MAGFRVKRLKMRMCQLKKNLIFWPKQEMDIKKLKEDWNKKYPLTPGECFPGTDVDALGEPQKLSGGNIWEDNANKLLDKYRGKMNKEVITLITFGEVIKHVKNENEKL